MHGLCEAAKTTPLSYDFTRSMHVGANWLKRTIQFPGMQGKAAHSCTCAHAR